mgnify:CR=1 FL=1
MAPVFKTDPEIVSTFDTLKDETLSDTIPQIAEVRVLRDYPYRHFAVVKYVMNKAMQEFIGLNTSDTVSCLQTGMKLPKIAKGDSIDFSKNYYRFYIKQFQEKFKKAREEQLVNSTTRFNIEGIVTFFVFCIESLIYSFIAFRNEHYLQTEPIRRRSCLDLFVSCWKEKTPAACGRFYKFFR